MALALSVMLLAARAHAHAILVESTPRDNAVLSTTPREVVLRFNARVEKSVSRGELVDVQGRRLALSAATGAETTIDRLAWSLPALAPGYYRLEYRVLASDGHASPGLIRFRVLPGRRP